MREQIELKVREPTHQNKRWTARIIMSDVDNPEIPDEVWIAMLSSMSLKDEYLKWVRSYMSEVNLTNQEVV